MNISDQIVAGWSMGYAAEIETGIFGRCVVVSIETMGFEMDPGRYVFHLRRTCGAIIRREAKYLDRTRITKFIYAGKMTWGTYIEKGQKFKMKNGGAIFEGWGEYDLKVLMKGVSIAHSKIDIEPIFN